MAARGSPRRKPRVISDISVSGRASATFGNVNVGGDNANLVSHGPERAAVARKRRSEETEGRNTDAPQECSKMKEECEDYPTHNGKRVGIIIDIENFRNNSDMMRKGSQKDSDDIKKLLEDLKYEVTVIKDPTEMQLYEKHREFIKRDFSKTSVLVAFVMSHGCKTDHFLLSDGAQIHFDEIFSKYFMDDKLDSLHDKAKVCFIQACQGPKVCEAYEVSDRPTSSSEDNGETEDDGYADLKEGNRYIAVSTLPEHLSSRNTVGGSWFMQSLVKFLRKYATTLDVDLIMRKVKKDVVEEKRQKQCPNVRKNTLTRNLYLGRTAQS